MSEAGTFNGFPEEGLQFLRDIEVNNNKEWFQENRETFDAALMAPAQDFVAACVDHFRTMAPVYEWLGKYVVPQ